MKGRVVFWFTFDEQRNLGLVLFRLFGQRCQNCSPKSFEHAMWYPEEVVKVGGANTPRVLVKTAVCLD